jgi:hypothetical protein
MTTVLRECFRADIVVPMTSNAKVAHDPVRFECLDALVTAIAGGHRRHDGVHGDWRAWNGEFMPEDSRQYTTTLPPEHLEHDVRIIEEFIRRVFEQQAVCIEITPILATQF